MAPAGDVAGGLAGRRARLRPSAAAGRCAWLRAVDRGLRAPGLRGRGGGHRLALGPPRRRAHRGAAAGADRPADLAGQPHGAGAVPRRGGLAVRLRCPGLPGRRRLQAGQRHARPRGRRPGAAAGGRRPPGRGQGRGPGRADRGGRVRGAAGRAAGPGRRRRGGRPAAHVAGRGERGGVGRCTSASAWPGAAGATPRRSSIARTPRCTGPRPGSSTPRPPTRAWCSPTARRNADGPASGLRRPRPSAFRGRGPRVPTPR